MRPSTDAELCVTTIAEQIMGMPERAAKRWWTEEEFYAARGSAPPGERWELVDGDVLVTPGPHWMHQRVIARLFELIAPYVRAGGSAKRSSRQSTSSSSRAS